MPSDAFERIFNAIPANYLVYDLEWNIVAATDSLLESVNRQRQDVVGRNQFDVFPDKDPDKSGYAAMAAFRERILAEKKGHIMPITRYDVAGPDGIFQPRYWRPVNEPVFDDGGEVQYIIHGVEDVTASVGGSEMSGGQ